MITSVLSLAIVLQVYYNFCWIAIATIHVQDTIANLNAKCRLYYKNYFSGKPSYSVTKTMKFITTFDKKNVASYYTCTRYDRNLTTNLSDTSLAIAIVL